LALSKLALNTVGQPTRRPAAATRPAILRAWRSLSITHGPMISSGFAPPQTTPRPIRTGSISVMARTVAGPVGGATRRAPAMQAAT
jgi:hypothetical protein